MHFPANTSVLFQVKGAGCLIFHSFYKLRTYSFRNEDGSSLARHHLCLHVLRNYGTKHVRSPS
jgi:DNA relaxase NicK